MARQGVSMARTVAGTRIAAGTRSANPNTNTDSIINYHTNPSFENNSNFWDLEAGYTRTEGVGYIGNFGVTTVQASGFRNFVTTNNAVGIPLLASTDYILSFYYKMTVSSGNAPVLNVNKDSAYGTTIASDTISVAADWTRKTLAFTTDSSTAKVWIRIWNNNGNVSGVFDNFQVEIGTSATAYFDGSQPFCSWNGIIHNSTSTKAQIINGRVRA